MSAWLVFCKDFTKYKESLKPAVRKHLVLPMHFPKVNDVLGLKRFKHLSTIQKEVDNE